MRWQGAWHFGMWACGADRRAVCSLAPQAHVCRHGGRAAGLSRAPSERFPLVGCFCLFSDLSATRQQACALAPPFWLQVPWWARSCFFEKMSSESLHAMPAEVTTSKFVQVEMCGNDGHSHASRHWQFWCCQASCVFAFSSTPHSGSCLERAGRFANAKSVAPCASYWPRAHQATSIMKKPKRASTLAQAGPAAQMRAQMRGQMSMCQELACPRGVNPLALDTRAARGARAGREEMTGAGRKGWECAGGGEMLWLGARWSSTVLARLRIQLRALLLTPPPPPPASPAPLG